jgi:glutamate synthase domain-containing protein 2/glutamate synthase domain-containing protein 1/glutamate synthase domain-containing protein 3
MEADGRSALYCQKGSVIMSHPIGLPPKQGLYDPKNEHDACGIGFVVNIKGQKSNKIVAQALEVLCNLDHRGARGSEPETGDGAGILMQIPHRFFQSACVGIGIDLPWPGKYGVGMVFLSPDRDERRAQQKVMERIVKEEGQTVLGWRSVPTDNSHLGESARHCEPMIRQIFIGRNDDIQEQDVFERKLYVIRKLSAKQVRYEGNMPGSEHFYIGTLSSRLIAYKGMLTPAQVQTFFLDLHEKSVMTSIALVHSRFSTNTFPSWELSHPYRMMIHNGEINTKRGNVNWMHTRQGNFQSELWGDDLEKVLPVTEDPEGSDSAVFDNSLEFLTLSGRSASHVMMMMVPEPWENHESMSDEKRAFYEYHSSLMEPWDGPASIAFTDGVQVGACLDRNGLRPSRYYVTKDDMIVLASEVGVLNISPERVLHKKRLQPGRMLLVDTEQGRIVSDDELKKEMSKAEPYRDWLDEHLVSIGDLPKAKVDAVLADHDKVLQRQQMFGYTYEDLRVFLGPMITSGKDPVGSMGNDSPLAVLSNKPHLLYSYFKQLFAQVTNPPIDPLREELITSAATSIGPERNLLHAEPESCHQIRLPRPILTNEELERIRGIDLPGFKSITLPIVFKAADGEAGLVNAMDNLFEAADQAISAGVNLIVISDRSADADHCPIPALLATSGLHHHLIRDKTRTRAGLVVESGEPREVHHFCTLLGYGAQAINPYMVFESLGDMVREGMVTDSTHEEAIEGYIYSAVKGVVKVTAKMGISTIKSYRGGQIFEAVGLADDVVDRYFTWTDSRIGGIGMDVIAQEALIRHEQAYPKIPVDGRTLDVGGQYQWRQDGEHHLFNPLTIHKLQQAARGNDYEVYREYANLIDDQSEKIGTLRGLLDFDYPAEPIPIEEVESVEELTKRFKSGAMSYGSISKEAHEALAIAMNRIGGRSNTGEGGEDPERYLDMPNGDSKNSAIKQVASGRFGVTSNYLVHAKELQIKMAQGAKPGEGGELPGKKVYPWIAKVRHSTPGVELISPPPHHDIYSIEDLAQLIHDLKNSNTEARINVKLVSEVGVGTIAAGVAKGHADVVLISGHDGGTGASPQTSIKNAGLPWELGLAETHQTLVINNLRSRIVVETDGQLKTGRDVAVAALLGAEEFGFATTGLVAMGCIMMRVCHLDTCPVGVATQNPDLRAKFTGSPDHIVNFLNFVAQDLREWMAKLGFRTINEMVGQVEKLKQREDITHWKAKHLDLSKILYKPVSRREEPHYCCVPQDHKLENSIDNQTLLDLCDRAISGGEKVHAKLPVRNINRVVGTILGSEVTRRVGPDGLLEDTIHLHFDGSAGQSFGAFVPSGITLELEGDANDYFGKGLSGGKLVLYPPNGSTFVPRDNIIVGNVAFYGATNGEAYIRGMAGERFCVRNSGVRAVVEAVGDHACEYMTGGRVVVLGPTGRNFAAGMSGGVAYVYDEDGTFAGHCNQEMSDLEPLKESDEVAEVKGMIERHASYTGSALAGEILANWGGAMKKFVRVMPRDYRRIQKAIETAKESGLSGDDAMLAAFREAIAG